MNTKKSYSVLSLALICMMLFTSFYLPPIEASAESYNNISSDEIPSDVKRTNIYELRLNEDLYIKQGILVYGDYTDVMRIRENDFKAVAGGYYHTDVAGEYRFHGFTYSGSLYTNEDFPEDMAMTMGMDQYPRNRNNHGPDRIIREIA